MENHVSQQLTAYLTAALLGAASAMVYDLLRAVRLRRRRDRRLTGLADGLYITVVGLLLLWFTLRIGEGELRLYMLDTNVPTLAASDVVGGVLVV